MNHDEVAAHALIGDEAKKFLESDIGKTIIGIAHQEIRLIEKALVKVDYRNEQEILRLQNEAWRLEKFEDWIVDLFNKGEQALKIWQHENNNNN